MYTIGIYLYKFVVFLASFFNAKAKKLHSGQVNTLDDLRSKIISDETYIWFHAASLGEFEQGRPVIECLKNESPDCKILLSFFSPSGYEVRNNYPFADVVCYLPIDTPRQVRLFLSTVKISKAIFIKYEFWPNFIRELNKRNIPVYSISAIFRPDQIFFKWYGRWYKKLLMTFRHIYVQDDRSYQLLCENGFTNVSVAGDTRFDRVVDLASQARKIPLVEAFVANSPHVVVAGSTWPGDEQLLVRYLLTHENTKLILVPHEIHESHLVSIEKLLPVNSIRFTLATESNVANYSCLIVDTIGMLSSIYQYGNLAYIGGGFGVGIHNTLEAAVWNIPVVFGPNYHKFREARGLIAANAAFSIHSYDGLLDVFSALLKENKQAGVAAGNYVRSNKGATHLIVRELFQCL